MKWPNVGPLVLITLNFDALITHEGLHHFRSMTGSIWNVRPSEKGGSKTLRLPEKGGRKTLRLPGT